MSDHAKHTDSLNKVALSATIHCLTGCSIGEVAGMVLGMFFGLATHTVVVLSVALAFVFGYGLTMLPLLRAGTGMQTALKLALASDTASIIIMEIVDNGIMLVIPGAMTAGLGDPLFWGSMAFSIVLAGAASFPVVRYLISRGRGHAVVHKHHASSSPVQDSDDHSHHAH